MDTLIIILVIGGGIVVFAILQIAMAGKQAEKALRISHRRD